MLSFIDGLGESDFASTPNDLPIKVPSPPGKALCATSCSRQVPNFYFHVVTAYAILRHGGVDLGKTDHLGDLPFVELRTRKGSRSGSMC